MHISFQQACYAASAVGYLTGRYAFPLIDFSCTIGAFAFCAQTFTLIALCYPVTVQQCVLWCLDLGWSMHLVEWPMLTWTAGNEFEISLNVWILVQYTGSLFFFPSSSFISLIPGLWSSLEAPQIRIRRQLEHFKNFHRWLCMMFLGCTSVLSSLHTSVQDSH